jgi:hypothetical protein
MTDFTRGDRVEYRGLKASVLFAFPNGTPDAAFAWAKIVIAGSTFKSVPMTELSYVTEV